MHRQMVNYQCLERAENGLWANMFPLQSRADEKQQLDAFGHYIMTRPHPNLRTLRTRFDSCHLIHIYCP